MTVSTYKITKYSEITLATVAGAGLALITGTTIGVSIATGFLLDGKPHHALGSCLYTIYSKERDVIQVTKEEMQNVTIHSKELFLLQSNKDSTLSS
jgi:hypothetical protein